MKCDGVFVAIGGIENEHPAKKEKRIALGGDDIIQDRADHQRQSDADGKSHREACGFNRLKRQLRCDTADYIRGSVYDLDTNAIGMFDIVLFFGVIYHLRYPLLALDKIFDVCAGELYVESFVIDNHFLLGAGEPQQLTAVHPGLENTPIWRFVSCETSQRCRASSGETTERASTRRR